MRKISKSLILIFSLLIIQAVTCKASDKITKIYDLIENSISTDKKEVMVQGEVIGEILERGEFAWININDKSNSIGIWLKQDYTKDLKYFGDYKTQGDVVLITGQFHRSCSEHGGDVDIHCTNIQIITKGYKQELPLSMEKLVTAILLSIIIVIFFSVIIKSKKRG